MTTAHTATPMTVRNPQPSTSPAYTIVDANGNYVAHLEIRSHSYADRDAQFIVRACNAHDDLVKALRYARNYIEDCGREDDGSMSRASAQEIARINAALAKVGAQ